MVTGEYPPQLGGVGDYTALLSSHLLDNGAEITVFTSGSCAQTSDSVPVVRWDRPWGFSCWPRILSVARDHRAQIVHIQYQAAAYGMHPFANILPGYLRLRLRDVKTVTTFHDLRVPYLFPKAGPLRGAAIRILDMLSHSTVFTNDSDLKKMDGARPTTTGRIPRRWFIPLASNLECAPPMGFDRAEQRQQWGAGEDTLVLSYFGFMNSSKGVEFLLLALEQLVARGLDSRLVVIGGETGDVDPTNREYAQKIRQLIASLHLEERIYYTGFLPPSEVSAALLSSDICVLPFRDGASLRRGSLMAAIVHGLPVVSTFPQQPDALFVNGENIAMVKRDSPHDIADAVELLWRNPSAKARLSRGAKQLACHFQWPDIARRHMEMYDTLLSR
jgi:glycosyltransferase involved in cell wall biosynthesis